MTRLAFPGRGSYSLSSGGMVTTSAAQLLLDILATPAARAYSLRKLRAAYAGSAIRVRRSNDNAEQDIGFDGSNNFDTATLASFVGANDGFVTKWYDQSINADHAVQATTGNQPRIVLAGTIDSQNGVSSVYFAGGINNNPPEYFLESVASFSVADGCAVTATTDPGPTDPLWYLSTFSDTVDGGGPSQGIEVEAAGPPWASGTYSTISTDNGTNHIVWNSVLQNVRGSGGSASWTAMAIGRNRGLSRRCMRGWISEGIVWASALSSGDRTTVYQNQKTYYSTP